MACVQSLFHNPARLKAAILSITVIRLDKLTHAICAWCQATFEVQGFCSHSSGYHNTPYVYAFGLCTHMITEYSVVWVPYTLS